MDTAEDFIDLHTHSNASDGSFQPGGIPELARAAGLRAVALTDHDTVNGLPEFCAAADSAGIECIPGIELASLYSGREIHIVGLFIDYRCRELQDFCARMCEARMRRNEQIRLKLNTLGYPVTYEHPAFSGDNGKRVIGRPSFAVALMDLYGFSSTGEVFEKLLKNGRPAFVQRELPPPEAAIKAIHAAGGISVWAHPVFKGGAEYAFAGKFVKKFAMEGLDALEVYYSLFNQEQTAILSGLAARYGLARSGGSDFHGSNMRGINIGTGAGRLKVPYSLLNELRSKQKRT